MSAPIKELMNTAARTLMAHHDAGRVCDRQSLRWAEAQLTPDIGGETRAAAKQIWRRFGRDARVLAVLEGYVVFRFKGAPVHAMHWKAFEKNFVLKENQE